VRLPLLERHRAAGGRVVSWDFGYWDREHGMRLSVDSLHPTEEQLAMAPGGMGRRSFELREDADPNGPILLIGLGKKSVWAYRLKPGHHWELKKVASLRQRFPGRTIYWRPKGRHAYPLERMPIRYDMPIEQAMKGCSLLVCHHSNCAVDAAVAGVPVECEGGAALALYRHGPAPAAAERQEFLRRLSWWEWTRDEAPAAWEWIGRVTA
jgi:hypothetical protein